MAGHTAVLVSRKSDSLPPPPSERPDAGRSLQQVLDGSRAILDQMHDAVFVFDTEKNIVFANTPSCMLLGHDRAALEGMRLDDILIETSTSSGPVDFNVLEFITRVSPPPFDATLRANSDSTVLVRVSTSLLRDESGLVVGGMATISDVRQRRRSEEQLARQKEMLEEEVQARIADLRLSEERHRMLLERIPAAVVCVDPEGRVSSFNAAAKRAFSWDDGIVGIPAPEAWNCIKCEDGPWCIKKARESGVWVSECLMRQSGREKSVVFHTCSTYEGVLGEEGGTIHVISDMRDPHASRREVPRNVSGRLACDAAGELQILTHSKRMLDVLDMISVCADSSATVLVSGESGTGKELVARALHHNSQRSGRPFVAVNCAALQGHLLASELFGHVKGAFTGAVSDKAGLLETADGGTLFIDELGDMPIDVQAMFLRVLESGRFRKLGGTEEHEVDVRIIGATNKDLKSEVEADRFRHDLFYRLHVLNINMPPLRERREDIPLLAEHFLSQFIAKDGKSGRTQSITPIAMQALCEYQWPGNIRELRNAVEQAFVVSRGSVALTEQHLPLDVTRPARGPLAFKTTKGVEAHMGIRLDGAAASVVLNLEEVKRRAVTTALEFVDGNRTRAAAILGIARGTLISKIKEYGL